MNNRSFIRSSPLHVVHILKYPIALKREKRNHELKSRRYAGTTCTIHEAVLECTHRNVQIEMQSDLRLASLASFDSHNHIQASRSQSAHVNIAWNTIQDTNYLLSLPQNSTKPRSRAPRALMGNQSLRMSHAVSCTWVPTKWCGVWLLALLETCCAKLQKNSKCRSYLRYRRRHETLLSAGRW